MFVGLFFQDPSSGNSSGGRPACPPTCVGGGLGIGLAPIVHFASDELRVRIVPQCLNRHKSICLAITEPGAGEFRVWSKQHQGFDMLVLRNASPTLPFPFSCLQEFFTVAVRTGGEGMGGISLLLIDEDYTRCEDQANELLWRVV
ncbi:MAG: hypothetical protein BJ554DRAFT_502 [Olpidium bornovanus]|uniref:Uncharacterized protein n=1 Tax=Olpidium bornovanus TaxID=278681 RepID=A0A8H7ZTM7_9FUNG|nr:MAG: hypothetical protein BJ554DRAFT_502 [Olpidium bornovanus]